MQTETMKRLSIVILTLALGACVSIYGLEDEEALTKAGAKRLNPEEVKAHVTGKTEEWLRGGGYYGENGELKVIWRKVFSDGSWEVAGDGTLCYDVPRWERSCHIYMEHEGEIITIVDGMNVGIRPLYEGNKLAPLGRYNSSLNWKK